MLRPSGQSDTLFLATLLFNSIDVPQWIYILSLGSTVDSQRSKWVTRRCGFILIPFTWYPNTLDTAGKEDSLLRCVTCSILFNIDSYLQENKSSKKVSATFVYHFTIEPIVLNMLRAISGALSPSLSLSFYICCFRIWAIKLRIPLVAS